jgi:hypothetical protein
MPTTTLDRLTEIQDTVIDTVESFQQPVVDTVRRAVALVEERVPELPTDQLTAHLPTARELIDNQFAFAGRLLDASHQLTIAVLEAIEPVTDKVVKPVPVTKARTTTKKTAEAA